MDPTLSQLAPDRLTARLYQLRGQERRLLVDLLWHLAEVDRRRLYLDMAFPSLFAFATGFLGYSKAAAFRRTTAARLVARFPIVADYLADGRLSLTTLVELRDVLAAERLGEILGRAAGRTEDEVKELVAALAPRPAPADLFRRLPASPVPAATDEATGSGPEPAGVIAGAAGAGSRRNRSAGAGLGASAATSSLTCSSVRPAARPRISSSRSSTSTSRSSTSVARFHRPSARWSATTGKRASRRAAVVRRNAAALL